MQPTGSPLAGIGVDIVERERVTGIRYLERFAEYFLTRREMEGFQKAADPVGFIASRWAAKEAVIKAFPGLMKPHGFEIVKDGKKPAVRFLATEVSEVYDASVSISHSTKYAAGFATVTRRSS